MSDTNNQQLLLVTGPGGTGKSYLIHTTVGHLTLKLGKFVHVLATSAAYLLGGQTVHRFFRLGPDLKTYLQFGTLDCCMVANVDVLTIDECSMMIARLLEKIHELCCFATIDSKKSLLFPGKSVLLYGVLCGSTSTRLSSVRIAGRQEMLRMERFSIGYALVTTPHQTWSSSALDISILQASHQCQLLHDSQ